MFGGPGFGCGQTSVVVCLLWEITLDGHGSLNVAVS